MSLLSAINTKSLLAIAFLLLSANAQAGFVTTHEAAVNDIFSQTVFGSNTIEIRYDPTQEIINDALLVIDTVDKITSATTGLLSLSDNFTTDLSLGMFFVDDINECGGFNPLAVGCAARIVTTSGVDGSFIDNFRSFTFFESNFVAGSSGAHVIGHELAHIFGLTGHVGEPSARDNLMNAEVASNSVTTLTLDQVNTIFDSNVNAYIQNDNGQSFIQVSPIALVASVPEPSTYLMLSIGLFILGFHKRRQIDD